ncbi:MAG: peptidoglycan DD-metalloendopeptidase family protein, partial [Rhodospirillaceae bacterium]|nr:peptidoglycan DD-metalloendopeptidase family protein [Rhodospirillaceae bacterium]
APTASAQQAPGQDVPAERDAPAADAADRLDRVGDALDQIRDQGSTLARELDAVEGELEELRTRLVASTDQVQVLHRQIAEVEAEIAVLDAARSRLEEQIAAGRRQIAVMVESLHRLARVPSGLLLGLDEAPMDRFRAGVIVRSGIESVRTAMAQHAARIERLGDIRATHVARRDHLEELRADLDLRTASLEADIERRQWLIDRAREAVSLTQGPLDALAEETGDLGRIVADLEAREPVTLPPQAVAAAVRDVVAEARGGGAESLSPVEGSDAGDLNGLWFGNAQIAAAARDLAETPAVGPAPLDERTALAMLDPNTPLMDLIRRDDGLMFEGLRPAVPVEGLMGGDAVTLPSRPLDGDTGALVASTGPTRDLLPLPVIDGVVLPVDGWVESQYGDPDLLGEPLSGIRVRTGTGSPVVSPLDGTVRFVGELPSYGETLILEHPDGYHSVIAGLGQVNVAVGQEVLLGEPVGVVSAPQNDHSGTSILYYELRQRGRPVDPLERLGAVQRRGSQ